MQTRVSHRVHEADATHCATLKVTSDHCLVCNPCPPDEMDESEDPEMEFQESEVHECEVLGPEIPRVRAHKSDVHDSDVLDTHSSKWSMALCTRLYTCTDIHAHA